MGRWTVDEENPGIARRGQDEITCWMDGWSTDLARQVAAALNAERPDPATTEPTAEQRVIRRFLDGWHESTAGQFWTRYDFRRGDQGTPDEPMTDGEAAAIRAALEQEDDR